MVHLPTLEAMRRKLNDNLKQYIEKHPGQFVLFEGTPLMRIHANFYRTSRQLEEAIAKSKGTTLVELIPVKTHRFNKGNKTLECLTHFIDTCPNDNETQLVCGGPVELSRGKYSELAYCPDCGYQVFREASKEAIKWIKEHPFYATNRQIIN